MKLFFRALPIFTVALSSFAVIAQGSSLDASSVIDDVSSVDGVDHHQRQLHGGTIDLGADGQFELFDQADLDEVKAIIEAQSQSVAPFPSKTGNSKWSRGFLGRSSDKADVGAAGSPCNSADDCMEDFSCMALRCIPTAQSCLAKAVSKFTDSFDTDTWKTTVLENANITHDSLMDAVLKSTGYDDFQNSETLRSLVDAIEFNIPQEVYRLQDSVNLCDNMAEAGIADRAPTSGGTIVYMGLHMELSVILDLAMSVFWAVGGNPPAPRGFIRGTFGAEAGINAEISGLLGFAFTGTSADIIGGAVTVDVDGGLIAYGGMAVVANLNGLASLEFTLGVGAGGGIGLGYSITSALDPTPPTTPETPAPSISTAPSTIPSVTPSTAPSAVPSTAPSNVPSTIPSAAPSTVPSTNSSTSTAPSTTPSATPSTVPSTVPSTIPSTSTAPSTTPSGTPSTVPSTAPSAFPTETPCNRPSPGGWFLGNAGESCDTVCTTCCNENGMNAVDDTTKVAYVATQLGVTCGSTAASAFDTLPGFNINNLFCFAQRSGISACGASSPNDQRFCCCGSSSDCPTS